jgi:hypothetical protein
MFISPDLPKDSNEYWVAADIWKSLMSLSTFIGKFDSAVLLFEFVSNAIAGPMRSEWRFIAARDAAMQVFHFSEAFDDIRRRLRTSPAFLAKADIGRLRGADKSFRKFFPGLDLIRHSIAHAGTHLNTRDKYQKHAVKGPKQFAGISLAEGTNVAVNSGLDGNVFTMTGGGDVLTCEISRRSADQMHDVLLLIAGAFQDSRIYGEPLK